MIHEATNILQDRRTVRALIACLESGDPGPLAEAPGHRWKAPESLSAYHMSAYLGGNGHIYVVACLPGISASSSEIHFGLCLVAIDWATRNISGIGERKVCFISITDTSIQTISLPPVLIDGKYVAPDGQGRNYNAHSATDIAELLTILRGEFVEPCTKLGQLARDSVRC